MHPIIFLKNTWIYFFLILHTVVPRERNECNPSTWVGRGRDKLYKWRPYLSAVVFLSFHLKNGKAFKHFELCSSADTPQNAKPHAPDTKWGWWKEKGMKASHDWRRWEGQNWISELWQNDSNQTMVLSGFFNTTERTAEVFYVLFWFSHQG